MRRSKTSTQLVERISGDLELLAHRLIDAGYPKLAAASLRLVSGLSEEFHDGERQVGISIKDAAGDRTN